MNKVCHIIPINLCDVTELDSLVEHRRVFNLNDCQLNIFETYHQCSNVVLSYDGLVVSSMMRGRKKMHLSGSGDFDFVPGESVILPEGVSMKVDFPEADMSHPVQCATLALDWDMVHKNLDFLNHHYPNTEAPYEWRLNFSQYHFQNNRELAGSISRLISISMEDNAAKDALADLSLKFLLLRIIQTQNLASVKEHHAQPDMRFSAAFEYIRKNLSQKITIDTLAQLSCMSKPLFFRAFKSFSGITPVEFIVQERIKLAKQLLREDPTLNITSICYQTGFNNLNYFIRQFKRIEGVTPKSFR